jgi:hypothetical protein
MEILNPINSELAEIFLVTNYYLAKGTFEQKSIE